ncbi:MAG: sigma-54-dependent Fis family transcriptional regulator [bacterium]|nr:sigma-54-dependent Fis family transcriptional regulator [bacterium]
MRSVVLLSRRHRLYAAAAEWKLRDVELFLFDSPSEALARISVGSTAVFVFDTRDYPRYRHVLRKFFSMKTDADVALVGPEGVLENLEEGGAEGALRRLPSDAEPDEIRQVVRRLLALRRVRERSGIVGRSRAIAETLSLIAHAAPLDVNVLILGESGTGKELVARAIHDNSTRSGAAFVSLNCGAMSEGVLESELFGHVRGAFTGAVADHDGVFKRADGGTLFLDEVAEMPLGMQTRFLRALETGEFTPVGGRTTLRSDIRLVAATHRDLAADAAQGRFRQDLYYRLRVVVIETPPLRERREDIPVLVDHFLTSENERHGMAVKGLSRAAELVLLEHDWPGNVRELRNVVSSLVVLKQAGRIEVADLPHDLTHASRPGLYLPVPLGAPGGPELDPGVLASTLLEIRQDLKEIKAMLHEGGDARQRDAWRVVNDGRLDPAGDVVETFSGEAGFSPLEQEGTGDLQTAERTLIDAALKATGGNRRLAARRLGISERTLYRKLKLYGLS